MLIPFPLPFQVSPLTDTSQSCYPRCRSMFISFHLTNSVNTIGLCMYVFTEMKYLIFHTLSMGAGRRTIRKITIRRCLNLIKLSIQLSNTLLHFNSWRTVSLKTPRMHCKLQSITFQGVSMYLLCNFAIWSHWHFLRNLHIYRKNIEAEESERVEGNSEAPCPFFSD